MANHPLTKEQAQSAWNLVKKHGAVWTAANIVGMPESTLARRYNAAIRRFGMEPIAPAIGQRIDGVIKSDAEADTPEGRKDTRDAAFWRKRAVELQKQLGDAEHLAEQLAGLRNQTFTIPEWILDKTESTKGNSVVGLCISDVHAGEVVSSDELLGLNAYDIGICRKRLRRLFAAACEIPLRWTADTSNQGLLLVLAGDLISGDISEEFRISNEITSTEQHRFMVEELTAGIRLLRESYPRIHVVSVPGNHGRNYAGRPMAKLVSRASYDTLTAQSVADRCEADDKITFQITPSRDAVVPLLGRTIFVSHGDAMGTGGGAGFLGALAPIVRGAKKVEAQQSRANRRPDLILHGHFHTSANPGNVLSNGSVVGYSEYANGLRASLEPPMQWLWLWHQRWGLRERLEVQLEDPKPPALPRVRVPAAMKAA